jgi:hypothetical protein
MDGEKNLASIRHHGLNGTPVSWEGTGRSRFLRVALRASAAEQPFLLYDVLEIAASDFDSAGSFFSLHV